MSTLDKNQWAIDLLAALGNKLQPKQELIDFVHAWEEMESGASDDSPASFNPLNTTFPMPNSTDFNTAHVQNYTSYQQGIQATMATLSDGLYPTILGALKGNDAGLLTNVPFISGDLTVWVSGQRSPIDESYVSGILQIVLEEEKQSMSEVATFVNNVDQFISGFSVEMCVAAVGALIYNSTAPGSSNPHSISDVQKMMLQYYAIETGDDTNQSGMSLAQEQDMYTRMGLKFVTLPINASSTLASDIANVTNALKQGYPVAICGAETGYKYLNGDKVPYAWTPTGNHCIAATGIDTSGNFIVRDLASLVAADNFTPDTPQIYDNSKMDLISGLAIIPTWLVPLPPTPPTVNVNQRKAFELEWASEVPGVMLNSGIALAAWADYQNNKFHGPATSLEYADVDWNGNAVVAQNTHSGTYHWVNNGATFFSYH